MHESSRSSAVGGWTLFNLISTVVLVMTSLIVFTDADLVNGLRAAIRTTARSSFVLFLLTFVASGLVTLVSTPFTKYVMRNRKYLGLAFAFSHLVHAVLIGLYAYFSDEYRSTFSAYDNTSGFVGYAFIILMTLTSFRPTRSLIGETNWRILHTSGMWVFAYVFWKTNYELLSEGVVYVVGLNVMTAAMAIQLLGKVAKRIKRRPSASAA